MPGHGDWEQGEPEIMVTDGPCENTMNPTKDATYKFLAKFLKEVTSIFPDEYLFLGTITL
jgi:N-acetyl-beta-hexosaminidase